MLAGVLLLVQGNADQVPLFFAMPNKKSLVPVGAKQVAAKTTGHTKARFTAHLFVVDNGWIEEPLIIFKGLKKVPEDCRDLEGVHVVVNSKGFANSAAIQYWARTRLPQRRQTPFTRGKPFHLTLDAFLHRQDVELLHRQDVLHCHDVELLHSAPLKGRPPLKADPIS